jgi:hypothetical protein
MITLNSASGTGIISTTAGAKGVIASTGPFSPNSFVKVSYSFEGATSGIYAGLVAYKGNFAQSIVFPSSNLKFEIINPDPYNQINIDAFASSAEAFSPLSLSPALWLSDTGSDVSIWSDISGNNRHATQATAGSQPAIITSALNGRQVRRFDGIDDLMGLTTGLDMLRNVSGVTVIAAYKWITSPTAYKSVFGVSTGDALRTRTVIGGGLASQKLTPGGRRLDADGFQSITSTNNAPTTYFVHSVILDYANSDAFQYANNVIDGQSTSFQTSGNTSNTDSLVINIGSDLNSAAYCANIDIAEILVFPTALSDAERQNVELYLGGKYGIPVGFDPDAVAYFTAIATAGSSISDTNKVAVNAFITGCKADGIWASIKASCLLAGPDSLTGALVPLVGAAPTNFNFVSGDYSRTTGLVGDGTTKYLNSNRNNNADPQNNQHLAVRVTSANTSGGNASFIGNGLGDVGCSQIINAGGTFYVRTRSQNASITDELTTGEIITGTVAISRSSSATYSVIQKAGVVTTVTIPSETPFSQNTVVFGRNLAANSNARISFYSIGESLNLALLDARLTTYMASLV